MKIRKYEERDASRLEEIYNSSRMDEFIGAEGDFHLVPWAEDEYILRDFNDSKVYVCFAVLIFAKKRHRKLVMLLRR